MVCLLRVLKPRHSPDTGGGDRTAGQAREQNEPEREEAL